MHVKLLLAAAAALASVGVAQAQDRGTVDTLVFPSQDRDASPPDNEDAIRYYMRRHFPSDVTSSVQPDVGAQGGSTATSSVSRDEPTFLFPSQDRDTDSTPD